MEISHMASSTVCISLCGDTSGGGYESMIFIFDLGSREFTSSLTVEPKVRIDWDYFNEPACCVIGTKLYIFQGYRQNYHRITDGKDVYSFELSEGVSNLKLGKNLMTKETSMNDAKVWPKAAVTPHGKILVFSSQVYCYDEGECDFELFDPDTQIWHKLPFLPISFNQGRGYDRIFVTGFSFMKKNTFVLRTEVGIFSLDLNSPKNWKKSAFYRDECLPRHCGNQFLVIERKICLIPFRAFDIRVHGTRGDGTEREDVLLEYSFPDLMAFSGGYSNQSIAMTLLNHEEGKEREKVLCFPGHQKFELLSLS